MEKQPIWRITAEADEFYSFALQEKLWAWRAHQYYSSAYAKYTLAINQIESGKAPGFEDKLEQIKRNQKFCLEHMLQSEQNIGIDLQQAQNMNGQEGRCNYYIAYGYRCLLRAENEFSKHCYEQAKYQYNEAYLAYQKANDTLFSTNDDKLSRAIEDGLKKVNCGLALCESVNQQTK